MTNMESTTLGYHAGELAVARDPSHPGHLMPPILTRYRRVLDVGCGMGQTLIALELPEKISAFGVDTDAEAVKEGQRMVPSNVRLVHGSGNRLPFSDDEFDFVFSRVSLPYMRLNDAIREMRRVLAPGGNVWLALHSHRRLRRRILKAMRKGDIKDMVYCMSVASNSLLFHICGFQFSGETFQTERGLRRALTRAGFRSIAFSHGTFFIATASVASPESQSNSAPEKK